MVTAGLRGRAAARYGEPCAHAPSPSLSGGVRSRLSGRLLRGCGPKVKTALDVTANVRHTAAMNREIRMTVRLTPEDHARLVAAARSVDRSVSSFVRIHLMEATEKTLAEASPST